MPELSVKSVPPPSVSWDRQLALGGCDSPLFVSLQIGSIKSPAGSHNHAATDGRQQSITLPDRIDSTVDLTGWGVLFDGVGGLIPQNIG